MVPASVTTSRSGEEFDHMAVGIAQENLPGAIGPHFARAKVGFHRRKMPFPFIEVIDVQRKMIAAIVRMNRFGALADDVKFLRATQPEPRARKGKCRTRNRFKLKSIFVKSATCLDIPHVDRDMVQFVDFHAPFVG